MAVSTQYMNLTKWDSVNDFFSHSQLATNMDLIDGHDHSTGKGKQIPYGGLASLSVGSNELRDNAVIAAKIADSNVTTNKLANLAVVNSKLGTGSVGTGNLQVLPQLRVYLTGTPTILNNSTTAVAWDGERWDTGTGTEQHTGSSSLITCRTTGVYVMSTTIEWQANSTNFRDILIRYNGAQVIARAGQNGTGFTTRQTISTIYKLTAGDTVEVTVYQNSGSSLTLSGTNEFSWCWLSP